MNSTVCFKSWSRLRGVVGDVVLPCPVSRLKLAAWKHLFQAYESSVRQIPSWFVGVVENYANVGGLDRLVVGSSSLSLLLFWPGLYSVSRLFLWVVLGFMVWQIQGIPIGGVMSSARQSLAGWVGSMSISGWVSIYGSGQSGAVFRGGGTWMMCLWASAYFVVAAFLFFLRARFLSHSRWSE